MNPERETPPEHLNGQDDTVVSASTEIRSASEKSMPMSVSEDSNKDPNELFDSLKREKRLAMNRASAKQRRNRQKALIAELQQKVVEKSEKIVTLQEQNEELRIHAASLTTSLQEAQAIIRTLNASNAMNAPQPPAYEYVAIPSIAAGTAVPITALGGGQDIDRVRAAHGLVQTNDSMLRNPGNQAMDASILASMERGMLNPTVKLKPTGDSQHSSRVQEIMDQLERQRERLLDSGGNLALTIPRNPIVVTDWSSGIADRQAHGVGGGRGGRQRKGAGLSPSPKRKRTKRA